MGAAKRPPEPLGIGSLLSLPTQTAALRSGVKPTHHTSRPLLVVPVFPPQGRSQAAALVPVPEVTTPRSIDSMLVATGGRSTRTNSGW